MDSLPGCIPTTIIPSTSSINIFSSQYFKNVKFGWTFFDTHNQIDGLMLTIEDWCAGDDDLKRKIIAQSNIEFFFESQVTVLLAFLGRIPTVSDFSLSGLLAQRECRIRNVVGFLKKTERDSESNSDRKSLCSLLIKDYHFVCSKKKDKYKLCDEFLPETLSERLLSTIWKLEIFDSSELKKDYSALRSTFEEGMKFDHSGLLAIQLAKLVCLADSDHHQIRWASDFLDYMKKTLVSFDSLFRSPKFTTLDHTSIAGIINFRSQNPKPIIPVKRKIQILKNADITSIDLLSQIKKNRKIH